MANTQEVNHKEVQTDDHQSSKIIKTLQKYLLVVNRYRLHLFSQYTRANYSYEQEDLLNIRKKILDRFQLVIKQLEQILDDFQTHRITEFEVNEFIDQPLIKEVIETSLNADFSTDQWRISRRDLQEIKDDLHILELLVNRGLSKIDRMVNVTNFYT